MPTRLRWTPRPGQPGVGRSRHFASIGESDGCSVGERTMRRARVLHGRRGCRGRRPQWAPGARMGKHGVRNQRSFPWDSPTSSRLVPLSRMPARDHRRPAALNGLGLPGRQPSAGARASEESLQQHHRIADPYQPLLEHARIDSTPARMFELGDASRTSVREHWRNVSARHRERGNLDADRTDA